jgi:hypothetical protein
MGSKLIERGLIIIARLTGVSWVLSKAAFNKLKKRTDNFLTLFHAFWLDFHSKSGIWLFRFEPFYMTFSAESRIEGYLKRPRSDSCSISRKMFIMPSGRNSRRCPSSKCTWYFSTHSWNRRSRQFLARDIRQRHGVNQTGDPRSADVGSTSPGLAIEMKLIWMIQIVIMRIFGNWTKEFAPRISRYEIEWSYGTYQTSFRVFASISWKQFIPPQNNFKYPVINCWSLEILFASVRWEGTCGYTSWFKILWEQICPPVIICIN